MLGIIAALALWAGCFAILMLVCQLIVWTNRYPRV